MTSEFLPPEVTFLDLLNAFDTNMQPALHALFAAGEKLGDDSPAEAVRHNVHRAQAMMDDFAAYMRAKNGGWALNPKPFSPHVALQTWCQPAQQAAVARGVTLDLALSSLVPPLVLGDAATVGRVLMALIWNAIAFSNDGEVGVQSFWRQDGWQISIQDRGSGIADTDLPYIWEPFWRGASHRDIPTAGCGLGLPLAVALAHTMSGDVWLDDTSSRGSRFSVLLPLPAALPRS